MVTDFGPILHTTNGGVVSVDENLEGNVQLPQRFLLKKNYPNPANPETKISFPVPRPSAVTLKVYDALGREIAVPVNKQKRTGEYSLRWNAEGVPGGMYLHRVIAGNYVETKKMILIK